MFLNLLYYTVTKLLQYNNNEKKSLNNSIGTLRLLKKLLI
jgi:hypothetical protein